MGADALFRTTGRRLAFASPGRRPASAQRLDDGAVELRIADLDRAIIDVWSFVGHGDREPAILTARRGRAGASFLCNCQVCRGATEGLSMYCIPCEFGFGEGRIVACIRIPGTAAGRIDDLDLVLVAALRLGSRGGDEAVGRLDLEIEVDTFARIKL